MPSSKCTPRRRGCWPPRDPSRVHTVIDHVPPGPAVLRAGRSHVRGRDAPAFPVTPRLEMILGGGWRDFPPEVRVNQQPSLQLGATGHCRLTERIDRPMARGIPVVGRAVRRESTMKMAQGGPTTARWGTPGRLVGTLAAGLMILSVMAVGASAAGGTAASRSTHAIPAGATWGQGSEVTAPSNAAANPDAVLNGVACPSTSSVQIGDGRCRPATLVDCCAPRTVACVGRCSPLLP
jgi:hypothetical protein